MATTTTVGSNYAGKIAGGIIGATFKEGDTLSRNLLTVYENVNNTINLRKIAYASGKTAYACGHTPAGTITLSEKTITPIKAKNDFSICKEDFRVTWSEELVGASAFNPNMPSDIEDAILMEILADTAEDTDSVIWNGAIANPGECDGFIVQFAADGSVVKANNGITALNAATTLSNVEAHLQAAVGGIPIKMRSKQLTWLISPDIADFYMQFLVSKGAANGLGGNANTSIIYGRYTLEVVGGLPANTMVIYEKKNMVFATGLLGDHNEVAIVDEDAIGLLTGQVRGKLVYNQAVGYYNPSEIVWLLTTTA